MSFGLVIKRIFTSLKNFSARDDDTFQGYATPFTYQVWLKSVRTRKILDCFMIFIIAGALQWLASETIDAAIEFKK